MLGTRALAKTENNCQEAEQIPFFYFAHENANCQCKTWERCPLKSFLLVFKGKSPMQMQMASAKPEKQLLQKNQELSLLWLWMHRHDFRTYGKCASKTVCQKAGDTCTTIFNYLSICLWLSKSAFLKMFSKETWSWDLFRDSTKTP